MGVMKMELPGFLVKNVKQNKYKLGERDATCFL